MNLTVNNAGRNFNLELYAGSPDPAGVALVTFTVPTLNTLGRADYTFLPGSSFVLLPSTTYWLVAYSLTTGTSNQITWDATNPGVTATGIATYAGGRFNTPAVIPPTSSLTLLSTFEIDATLTGVPEPGAAGLLAVGFLVTGF